MTAARILTKLQEMDDISGVAGVGKGFLRVGDGTMAWTDLASQVELDAEIARAIAAEGVNAASIGANVTAIALKVAKAGDTMSGALGFRQAGDTNDRHTIATDGKLSWGPGNVITDTNLYRNGAGVLAMDGQLQARVASAGAAFAATFTGDVAAKFVVFGDGKHEWGTGAGARDTFLYRSAVGGLKTDGFIQATGGFGNTSAGTASVNLINSQVTGDSQLRYQIFVDGQMKWGSGAATPDVVLRRSGAAVLRLDDASLEIKRSTTSLAVLGGVVSGDTQDRFVMTADGAMGWGDGTAARDTTLGRSGASFLQTNSRFGVVRTLTSDVVFSMLLSGDAVSRFVIWGDAKHEWGDGTLTRDVNLYRSAAATLKTDGALVVGTNVTLAGSGAFIARTQTSGVSSAFVTRRSTDTVDRLNITADGAHEWGDGVNLRDVTLSRSTTGQLRISAPTAVTQTGTLTNGSAVITNIASTVGILAGMFVAGTGIPVQTVVLTVDSGTQVTVSVVATASGAQSLTFGWGTSLVVRGSASQPMTTGSVLQQWNDSADVPRATMYASGTLIVGTSTAGAYFEQRAQAAWVDVLRAVRAGSQVWALGDANPGAMFTPNVVTTPVLILRGMAAQSGDLLRLQDSTPTTLAKFDSVGTLMSYKAAATTSAYGSRVIADAQNRFQIDAAGKHEWSDGTAAVDVNLYRSSASILRSDSLIQTNRTSAALSGLSTFITGESLARFVVRADGQIEIGDGTATRDVVLRRSAAAILRMDDATLEIRRSAVGITAFATFIAGDTTDRFAINADGRQEWGDGTNARDAMLSRTSAGALAVKAIATNYTGTLAIGSAVVTAIASTAGILAGMFVSGTGIPGGTTVLSVDSGVQITLSANATANGAQTLTISRGSLFVVTSLAGQTTDLASFAGTVGTLQILAGGSIRANFNAGHGFGGGTSASTIMFISANANSNVALKVRGAAGQTQDIIRWEDSTPTTVGRMNKDGYFITAKKTAPADADLNASELAFWLDDTIGATKVMFKAKDSAGTVRTASLAMA